MSIVPLWQPIVAAAVIVWVAGAVIWMAMPWHKREFSKTADEEGARQALKGLGRGYYMLPHCTSHDELKDPELRRKFEEGPIAYVTVLPNGVPGMGGKLLGTFLYDLFVCIVCAYVLTRTGTTGEYLEVFRISGTVAFACFGVAFIQDSVWFGRPWSVTVKNLLDALIYALLTGGVFGWLVA